MSKSHEPVFKKIIKAVLPVEARKRIRGCISNQRLKKRKAIWDNAVAKDGWFVCKIPPKVKMKLYCDSMLSHQIFFEEFEFDERDFMLRFLRPGDVYADIGANVGLFTLIAAKIVGPTGRVFAFEPVQKPHKRLVENIQLNKFKNVQNEQVAFSDSSGSFEMMVAEDEMDGFNSFAPPYMGEHYARETVTTNTWDAFAGLHKLAGLVTLMKIDVEGWELKVLSGGQNLLSREDAPVLQVEFTDGAAKAAGSSCQEIYRSLESLGYKIYRHDRVTKTLNPDPIRLEYPYLNLYAIKDLAAAQLRLNGVR
jgi:FkbM family methyltransferase